MKSQPDQPADQPQSTTDPGDCGRAARAFHVMAKPIGPRCNLKCEYCYYLEKERLYPGERQWRISDETLARFVEQFIAAQPAGAPEIEFAWQGGEPTLLGLDFFRRVIELQTQFTPPGKQCRNTIQTNGVLLDDAWCEFLRAHDFLVGLSIDGPAELHDRYRRDARGQPTHDQVMRGLRLLQKHRVDTNALTVVNRHNGKQPRKVYGFLKDAGFEFIQFIPIVEPAGASAGDSRDPESLVSERSVRPRQFGRFLSTVFDEWVASDVGRVFVQAFDQALAAWMGLEPSLCIFSRKCGRALVLEHNGDLYCCDHFVTPEHRLGNINDTPLGRLVAQPRQAQFGNDKEDTLPSVCRTCPVRFACNGECPKNRLLTTPDGEPGLNYLCEGFKTFFTHIDPIMQAMASEVRQGRPAANVMHRLRRETAPKSSRPDRTGRNEPCPCGSGRKFKSCCARSVGNRPDRSA